MQRYFNLLLFVWLSMQSFAQPEMQSFTGNSLRSLLDSTRRVKDDSLRLKVNEEFLLLLTQNLSNNTELAVFDSINIGKITSDDGLISVYSWNIQQNSGENYYSAVIKNKKNNLVFPLPTQKSLKTLPTDKIFANGEWPGGLIYKIITRKYAGKTVYTLLSWDRYKKDASRKTIESLDFDAAGKPVFGAPVFKTKEGVRHRVLYEYAAQASFTLNYSRQKVILSGVRRSQKHVDDHIIVADRLIPLDENLQGQAWAMVPAGNTHDAYLYLDGYWIFTEDVIARNPEPDKKPQKGSEKPSTGLVPGK